MEDLDIQSFDLESSDSEFGFFNVANDDFDPNIDFSQWSEISNGIANDNFSFEEEDEDENFLSEEENEDNNSLWFNGRGSRFAATIPLNVADGGRIAFSLIFGSSRFPTENADAGEDVVLEFSVDGGATWENIATYDTEDFTVWTEIEEDIPLAAQTDATLFRWRQLRHDGGNTDNWALDNVDIDAVSPPEISLDDLALIEGDNGTTDVTFTVTLNAESTQTVTVDYATADGNASAESDYTPATGTLIFAPGQTSQTVTIEVIGETLIEGDENFSLNLSNPSNAIIADAQGVVTILNDDTVITGTIFDDTLTGTENGETIIGLEGSDIINGGAGDDILIGVNALGFIPGVSEIDNLIGGEGSDTFVIGDADRVYYEDANPNRVGRNDYAAIADFNVDEDIIQLHGSADDYNLHLIGSSTAILLDTAQTVEAIAVVQGLTDLSLDADYFSFVG